MSLPCVQLLFGFVSLFGGCFFDTILLLSSMPPSCISYVARLELVFSGQIWNLCWGQTRTRAVCLPGRQTWSSVTEPNSNLCVCAELELLFRAELEILLSCSTWTPVFGSNLNSFFGRIHKCLSKKTTPKKWPVPAPSSISIIRRTVQISLFPKQS